MLLYIGKSIVLEQVCAAGNLSREWQLLMQMGGRKSLKPAGGTREDPVMNCSSRARSCSEQRQQDRNDKVLLPVSEPQCMRE